MGRPMIGRQAGGKRSRWLVTIGTMQLLLASNVRIYGSAGLLAYNSSATGPIDPYLGLTCSPTGSMDILLYLQLDWIQHYRHV